MAPTCCNDGNAARPNPKLDHNTRGDMNNPPSERRLLKGKLVAAFEWRNNNVK
jgi:hypothetical protein